LRRKNRLGNVIDFKDRTKKLDKKALDYALEELKSLNPEKVQSLFIHVGLIDKENQKSTYTLHLNLDFHDFGYLSAYINYLNLNNLEFSSESRFFSEGSTDDAEISNIVDEFRTPSEDKTDEDK